VTGGAGATTAPSPASDDRLRALDIARFAAVAGGIGLAVDAGLIALEGVSAIDPFGAIAPGAAAGLGALGLGLAAAALASGGRCTVRAALRSAPEMYPFGAPWLQLGLYLLVIVGAAAVAHALLVAFTGADSGGAVGNPNGPAPLDLLLSAGSLLLWVLAVYAVYGLRRFIQMGRELDARRGLDPFGSRAPGPGDGGAAWVPDRRSAPPAFVGAAAAVGIVTAVVMVEVTVGIQLLETPIGPVAAPLFWWSQALTVGAAAIVASALGTIDRGVRDLERHYDARDAPRPDGAVPARTPPAPGFVP